MRMLKVVLVLVLCLVCTPAMAQEGGGDEGGGGLLETIKTLVNNFVGFILDSLKQMACWLEEQMTEAMIDIVETVFDYLPDQIGAYISPLIPYAAKINAWVPLGEIAGMAIVYNALIASRTITDWVLMILPF